MTVDQASESNGGKATITVTSADGTASKTVTVDFGSPLAKLARLDVTAPTKTEYQAGEDLDLTGMTVVAVYEKDGKVSAERTIAVETIRNWPSAAMIPSSQARRPWSCPTVASPLRSR